MRYKVINCDGSLESFVGTVKHVRNGWTDEDAKCVGDEEGPWFRGQGDESWGLIPKIYRPEFANADEKELRHEFQSAGLQLLGTSVPKDRWDWYFLMQHYGTPTRLLDWTINPLVALFFALEHHFDEQLSCDVAVWILDPWWLNKRQFPGVDGPMLPDWEETKKYLPDLEDAFTGKGVRRSLPIAIEPPHVDRRLSSQGSRFVVFGTTKDLTKTSLARGIRAKQKIRDVRLCKLTIPAKAVGPLLKEIDQLGFNRAVLFPDLGGLAAHICYRWRTYVPK
jgi:FRG domain